MVEIWTPVRVRWWGSLSGRSLRGSGHRSKYWIKIPSPWLFEQQKDRREEGDGSSTPWSLVLGPWSLVPASSLTAAQAADSFSFSFFFGPLQASIELAGARFMWRLSRLQVQTTIHGKKKNNNTVYLLIVN